jgi:hypothetical protein
MRYKYVVILKRESEKATNVLSFLLCLISAVYFIWSAISSSASSPGLAYFHTGIALVLLLVLIINLLGKGSNGTRMRYRYLLLIAALGWFASPLPWLAGIFIILAFLEHQTKRPLEIGFDDHQVVINTLIRRQYDWSAFTNIVLRDGLLTMDFSNNRLLQKEVLDDDEDEDDADEKEFNDYCQSRLSEAVQK